MIYICASWRGSLQRRVQLSKSEKFNFKFKQRRRLSQRLSSLYIHSYFIIYHHQPTEISQPHHLCPLLLRKFPISFYGLLLFNLYPLNSSKLTHRTSLPVLGLVLDTYECIAIEKEWRVLFLKEGIIVMIIRSRFCW